jgi:hypothetical protein
MAPAKPRVGCTFGASGSVLGRTTSFGGADADAATTAVVVDVGSVEVVAAVVVGVEVGSGMSTGLSLGGAVAHA